MTFDNNKISLTFLFIAKIETWCLLMNQLKTCFCLTVTQASLFIKPPFFSPQGSRRTESQNRILIPKIFPANFPWKRGYYSLSSTSLSKKWRLAEPMTNYDHKLSAGKWDEEMRQTQTYKERRARGSIILNPITRGKKKVSF